MNWRDRANMIRRFYLGRDAERRIRSKRADAGHDVDHTIDEGFRMLVIDRAVALINAYYEEGETDLAFEALCRRASDLAVASARLGESCETIDDRIFLAVWIKVEPMYDEGTAERLMVAFECGFGGTDRPRFRRV